MNLRRRVLDYTLAGILLLLPIVVLNSSLKEPEELNRFDHAVLRVTSPLQAAVSWVIEGIGGIWNGYVWLVDVEDENQDLRADNERLRRELAEARRAAADVEVLEELVGLRRRIAADTVGARVVAATMASGFRVVRVRVDRGQAEIEPGMPVVNGSGLVGRVRHAYGDYSDILLLTDPDSKVAVTIARTGAHGVLRGLADDAGYACEIDHLQGEDVAVGDEVVTDGLGGAFPAGLVIGVVTEVEKVEYGLFQKVRVAPAVDFSNLGPLLVLVAPPPPPDPSGAEGKRSEPALGATPR